MMRIVVLVVMMTLIIDGGDCGVVDGKPEPTSQPVPVYDRGCFDCASRFHESGCVYVCDVKENKCKPPVSCDLSIPN